jgi:signal transduction histidine kinase
VEKILASILLYEMEQRELDLFLNNVEGWEMADKANVLVVDDDLGPRESMRMILKPLHNVYIAEDGLTALRIIQEKAIDLVTLDLRMPGMHGIDVLKEIKKFNPNIEVIIVTGFGSLKSATEAMKYGVKGYITKPYNLSEITSIVEKALEQRRFNLKLRNFFEETLSEDGKTEDEIGDSVLTATEKNMIENDVSEDLLNVTEYKIKKMKEMQNDFSRENKVLEDKLIRSERLAIVGQMAAGYAHELNNSLTSMLGYTELVQTTLSKNYPELQDLLEKISTIFNQTERASKLSRNLLNLSRKAPSEREPTDIRKLLEQILSFTEPRAVSQDFKVVTDFESSLPLISVNPGRVEQVFLNLILNAFHAMTKGGTLTIRVKRIRQDMGDVLRLEFSDTGHGISQKHLKEIFDPFFSTKEGSGGTGLGLFISRKIVENYQGSIEVESKEQEGTTFIVEFPGLKR